MFNPEFLFIVCLSKFNAWVHFKNFLLQKNLWLCLRAPTKKTIIYFLWTGISFFVLEFGKIQLQSERRYLIEVLSTNEIAEYKRLKDETNTVKHRCEKSKCCVAMCLKKNLWSNSFSSLTKTWNSPFDCLSSNISFTQSLFLLFLYL